MYIVPIHLYVYQQYSNYSKYKNNLKLLNSSKNFFEIKYDGNATRISGMVTKCSYLN